MSLNWLRNEYYKKIINFESVEGWLEFIGKQKQKSRLGPKVLSLLENHDLTPEGHAVNYFSPEIQRLSGDRLKELGKNPIGNIQGAVNEIVKWKTAIQCGYTHDVSKGYFTDAESSMQWQWETIIYPLIQDFKMDVTVDLACGHGRNSEFLRQYAKTLHFVDINKSCIEACKERFGDEKEGVSFFYHVTDGNHLNMIEDNSVDFVYSWDSMVHFDKLIVNDYVKEISRVLKSGGIAFLHHSNLGAVAPDTDWAHNVGTRSDMSAELMETFLTGTGLHIHSQYLQGKKEGWGQEDIDCVSILRKGNSNIK